VLEEESNNFKRLAETARNLSASSNSLESDAVNLAIQAARDALLTNLGDAIQKTPEFLQSPALSERLFYFFTFSDIFTVKGADIVLNLSENPEDEKDRWIAAQQAVNERRRAGKHGWAGSPSAAQKLSYWVNKVYGTELYDETIMERLAELGGEDAPFWYFLEYGTGPKAFPQSRGTYFLRKTERELKGLVNYFLEQMGIKFEEEVGRVLDVPPEQDFIQWSVWYPFKGKQYRHQFDSRTGQFIKGSRVQRAE
jgi:hypothetical protein